MNKLFLFIILIVLHSSALAQTSFDDSVMLVKGKWMKRDPSMVHVDPRLSKDKFPIIHRKVDSIAVLFKQAYPVPVGAEAKWNTNFMNRPAFANGPIPYGYWSAYFLYYYNKSWKKVALGDETNTWAYVFVNTFHWFLSDSKLSLDDGTEIYMLPRLINEDMRGNPVYDPYTHTNAKAIVLTHNGKMPWKQVSQLEYLNALRRNRQAQFDKMISDNDAGRKKNAKMIEDLKKKKDIPEATKQQMITTLQNTAATAEVMFEKTLTSGKQMLETDLKLIDDYIRSNTSQTLQQQAVISRLKDFFFLKKFDDPNSQHAARLVVIDKDYFDRKLSTLEPQFMVMYWRWSTAEPGLFFKNELEKNFPIERLQKMVR